MAPHQQLVALFISTLALASTVHIGSCHVLKGSVTCMDCDHHSDLSGIKVTVKCSRLKKVITTITEEDGSFETNLPWNTPTSPASSKCHAKILGGPKQLFVSRKYMDTNVVKIQEDGQYSYTTSEPLKFYTKCPTSQKNGKLCGGTKNPEFGSAKTVDLPLPTEWGLAPTSYYLPILPIIGIP